jgi:multiple sugar transport system ATP-binding protein
MAEVQLDGVTKRYGDMEAVSSMSWSALQGEFTVLFGPSGAGKTTTLKLIAGLEMPDEGDVLFDGQSMGEVDTSDRNLSMAFENYALYPHLSVFDNIAFPMLIPGRRDNITKDEIKRRVTEIAQVLQIDMLLDRMPRNLSGGQRQRVALGRCLVRNPAVCLLDEPIAHLDAKLRHRMYAELKRIQRERGTTTVYATPAQSEAMAMADRIVILFEGRVQQIATPRELYECPASVAIARFGGEQPMNILPVDLSRDSGELFVDFAGQRFPAPANLKQIVSTQPVDDHLLLGVRPLDISYSSEQQNGALQAELYSAERLGRTAYLTARVGKDMIELAAKTDVEAEIGDMIWLSLDESPLYVFDAETEYLVAAAGVDGDDG